MCSIILLIDHIYELKTKIPRTSFSFIRTYNYSIISAMYSQYDTDLNF